MSQAMRDHDPNRGRWIPWVFVGGMLLVVLVNAVLIYASLSTFTGVTVPKAYERGRGYNEVLAEAARQDALGWAARVEAEGGRLILVITDREARGVPGQVEARLLRPLSNETVPLALGMTSPGRYAGELSGVGPGQWELRARLTGPNGARLDIRERLILR
jgi:nitrogen fixation protein FixH